MMIECDNMKNSKGQALVEFIIILPILLIIIMIIIDLGNIFIKKYSIENDVDIVSKFYKENQYTEINNYIKENNLVIEYEKEDNYMTINLSKNIKLNAPILNNILGREYKIKASKTLYE